MRIHYNNLIDAIAAAAITSTSEASSELGPENVAHDHVSKVWRTGGSVADEYVTFDLGSAQAATSVIIFAHTLTALDFAANAVELRKSTDNFAANDVLVASTSTFTAGAIVLTFSSTSSRYWRIKFTKDNAADVRDIGRVFLGTYETFTGLPDWDGLKIKPRDMSQTDRSEGGQTYSCVRPQYREVSFDASALNQTEVGVLKTISEEVGTHTPFFIIAIESGSDAESAETLYVKFTQIPERNTAGMGSDGNLAWDGEWKMAEEI